MLQGSEKGEKCSPIDDEKYVVIARDLPRDDSEEDQASDGSPRPEDRFAGVWKDVATKTDREHELMSRIIELYDDMTTATKKLDHIVTSITASDKSTRSEDVEYFKENVGLVSGSIKISLEHVVTLVGWDFEAMSPKQDEAMSLEKDEAMSPEKEDSMSPEQEDSMSPEQVEPHAEDPRD